MMAAAKPVCHGNTYEQSAIETKPCAIETKPHKKKTTSLYWDIDSAANLPIYKAKLTPLCRRRGEERVELKGRLRRGRGGPHFPGKKIIIISEQ